MQSTQTKQQQKRVMEESVMDNNDPFAQFYSKIDDIFNAIGIDKDGEDIIRPEEQQLFEAKFYRMYNKITHPKF